MPTFGARLTAAMSAKNIKVVDFAAAVYVGERTIYRWRGDHVWPPLDAVPFICKTLGVSADWLLGVSDTGGPVAVASIANDVVLQPTVERPDTSGVELLNDHDAGGN